MKFTQRSIFIPSTLHFEEISRFLDITAQEMFMKVGVFPIFKEKNSEE